MRFGVRGTPFVVARIGPRWLHAGVYLRTVTLHDARGRRHGVFDCGDDPADFDAHANALGYVRTGELQGDRIPLKPVSTRPDKGEPGFFVTLLKLGVLLVGIWLVWTVGSAFFSVIGG